MCNRHDSITFQIKDIVFSTEIEPRSAEYTPLHHWGNEYSQWSIINKEDIHDIKMYVCFSIISLMFFFMTTKKYDSVTPYGFFMTTDKKRQYYSLYFIWQRQQCYPLCFSSWRPIKNNSVTPYGFFHDDQRKMTVSPLMFHLIKTTVLPLMFHLIKTTVLPLVFFFHDDQRKTTVLPPMFYLINIDSVTPYVFFHDDQ